MIPGTAAAGAAAVLRDPEVLLAGQPDQQPGPQAGIHGPQNNQQGKINKYSITINVAPAACRAG